MVVCDWVVLRVSLSDNILRDPFLKSYYFHGAQKTCYLHGVMDNGNVLCYFVVSVTNEDSLLLMASVQVRGRIWNESQLFTEIILQLIFIASVNSRLFYINKNVGQYQSGAKTLNVAPGLNDTVWLLVILPLETGLEH